MGTTYTLESTPSPVKRKEAPALEQRSFVYAGRLWINDGHWHSDWDFKAKARPCVPMKDDGEGGQCCELDVSGGLRDRWYWAVTEAAVKEELSELAIEEGRWNSFMAYLGRIEIPFLASGVKRPCYFYRATADLLMAYSAYVQVEAYVAIFEVDVRKPNPSPKQVEALRESRIMQEQLSVYMRRAAVTWLRAKYRWKDGPQCCNN